MEQLEQITINAYDLDLLALMPLDLAQRLNTVLIFQDQTMMRRGRLIPLFGQQVSAAVTGPHLAPLANVPSLRSLS